MMDREELNYAEQGAEEKANPVSRAAMIDFSWEHTSIVLNTYFP